MIKSAIVTGASRGIGEAICHKFRTEGIKVIGVARSLQPLEDLSQEKIGPGKMDFVAGDLRDPEIIKEALQLATKDGYKLTSLVLNAASIGPVENISKLDLGEIKEAFDINVVSALAWIQAALPFLRQNQGKIILTSSGIANSPSPGFLSYSSNKYLLNMITSILSQEENEVCVFSVEPGIVDTKMFVEFQEKGKDFMPSSQIKFLENLKSSKKMLKPQDVAESFVYLALAGPKEKSGKVIKWNESWIKELKHNSE